MRFSNSWITAALLGGSFAVVIGACPYTNNNHCALNAGACGAGLICDGCEVSNDGCVEPSQLTNESCKVADSATTSSSSESTTTMTMTTSSTTMETVEPTTVAPTSDSDSDTSTTDTDTATTETTIDPTTTTTGIMCDPEQPASAECFQENPSKPFCVEMDVCGSCSELVGIDCTDIDADNPACHPDLGTCVECTADNEMACGPAEVCNQYKNDCGECFEHEQCPSGACDMKSGTCFPEANVVWVERRNNCAGENGSEDTPYCLLQSAIETEGGKDLVIMLKKGIGPQHEPVNVSNGIKVAIIGAEIPRPKISAPIAEDPRITVDSSSWLYISKVDLVDSPKAGPFLACSDSTLQLDQVTISGNGKPLSTEDCDIMINRSVITANTDYNLIIGSSFKLINSFVTSNKINDLGPFRIDANVEITHSTIVDNSGTTTSGFICAVKKPFKIRNSVLLGQPETLKDCEVQSSGTFDGVPGDLNMLFQAPQKGVFRPQPGAAEINELAEWADGDPYVDYDGVPRPNVAGATDFAGAARPE